MVGYLTLNGLALTINDESCKYLKGRLLERPTEARTHERGCMVLIRHFEESLLPI